MSATRAQVSSARTTPTTSYGTCRTSTGPGSRSTKALTARKASSGSGRIPWEDWEVKADSFHDAGDSVVVLMSQRARSKSTGMPVEMSFAQIWTLRDGRRTRMEMYSDPAEALEAAGLSE